LTSLPNGSRTKNRRTPHGSSAGPYSIAKPALAEDTSDGQRAIRDRCHRLARAQQWFECRAELIARLSRNVGQPDHILVNPIIRHKAERRSRSGEIWLAVTQHDGV
jgi:hypothetical protein